MHRIPAPLHRILDFLTVAVFAAAPSLLGLTGFAAALAYVLAAVHLAMTLLTRFTETDRKPVSLGLHGNVESIVGVTLVLLPWLLGWNGSSLIFYVAAGVVILMVWAFSRFRLDAARTTA